MSHDVNDPTGEIPPLPSDLRLAIDTSKITAPRLTVADLTSAHLGRRVHILGANGDWDATGILHRIDAESAQIEDHTLCDPEPTISQGAVTVTLKVGTSLIQDDGTATVEVL